MNSSKRNDFRGIESLYLYSLYMTKYLSKSAKLT